MSQEQFAKKVDVSRPTLSRFINGHLLPCVDTAIAIEKVTNGAVSVGGWVIEAKVTFAA